jgi:hypothetical protein
LLRAATISRSFSRAQVAVGQRLRLDALGGVDEQDHALAGGERPAHLVAEVDVAGRVDEVEGGPLPRHPDVLGLDRDAPLALDVHRVEVLRLHVPHLHGAGDLEDAVGQRRLAVVDVGDDRQAAAGGDVEHVASGVWGAGGDAAAGRATTRA